MQICIVMRQIHKEMIFSITFTYYPTRDTDLIYFFQRKNTQIYLDEHHFSNCVRLFIMFIMCWRYLSTTLERPKIYFHIVLNLCFIFLAPSDTN